MNEILSRDKKYLEFRIPLFGIVYRLESAYNDTYKSFFILGLRRIQKEFCMEIIKINQKNLNDINKANQPFEIIGKINPTFVDGIWIYTEELYDKPYVKAYEDDAWDYATYIDNPDKTIFLAYSGTQCIGQIVLRSDWNKYAFIEDICVAKAARGKGIGSALIQRAIEWAKISCLMGLALETQDNNLLACRFYAKCGFVIGAVNTMLYRNFNNGEFAVFWYLCF